MVACAWNLKAGRQRQEDPWDLLLNQIRVIGELQAMTDAVPKEVGIVFEESCPLASTLTHVYTCTFTYINMNIHLKMYLGK